MVARSAFGAAVHRFDADLGQWFQLRLTNAILSDSMAWTDPSGVIHLGDVDGDGKAELRSPRQGRHHRRQTRHGRHDQHRHLDVAHPLWAAE